MRGEVVGQQHGVLRLHICGLNDQQAILTVEGGRERLQLIGIDEVPYFAQNFPRSVALLAGVGV